MISHVLLRHWDRSCSLLLLEWREHLLLVVPNSIIEDWLKETAIKLTKDNRQSPFWRMMISLLIIIIKSRDVQISAWTFHILPWLANGGKKIFLSHFHASILQAMICCHASKLQFLFTSHRNIGFLGQRKRIVLPHQLVLVYPPTCTSWTVCLPCLPACLPTSELHAFKNVMACAAFPLLTVQLHHSKLLGACYKRPQFHVKNESLIHPCWFSSSKIATKLRFNLILHRACRPWSLVATLPHRLQSQNRTTSPA